MPWRLAAPKVLGETWLGDRMAGRARSPPDYTCGFVRYEVTPAAADNLP